MRRTLTAIVPTKETEQAGSKRLSASAARARIESGGGGVSLMKKMAMDKKNQGNTIRCTIVTDIGVSITDPQPVEKKLMQAVMAESAEAGKKAEEWTPHEGKVAVAAAGGQMSR